MAEIGGPGTRARLARAELERVPLTREALLDWGRRHPATPDGTDAQRTFVLDWRYVRVDAGADGEAVLTDLGEMMPGGRLADLEASMQEHWRGIERERGIVGPVMTWREFTKRFEGNYVKNPLSHACGVTDHRLRAARRHHLEAGPVTVAKLMAWGEEKASILADAPRGHGGCGCTGPIRGEPDCPCAMKSVAVMDGRWVRVTGNGEDMRLDDLGERA